MQCIWSNDVAITTLYVTVQQKKLQSVSYDFTAVMLVFQNKGMADMMVYQTNPPGIELYFHANTFLCFMISNPIWLLVTRVKTLYKPNKSSLSKIQITLLRSRKLKV